MKLITAVVTPMEFGAVKKALDTFGIAGLTITEVFQRDITGGRERISRLSKRWPGSEPVSGAPKRCDPKPPRVRRRRVGQPVRPDLGEES